LWVIRREAGRGLRRNERDGADVCWTADPDSNLKNEKQAGQH
jgi:hypothetical protein